MAARALSGSMPLVATVLLSSRPAAEVPLSRKEAPDARSDTDSGRRLDGRRAVGVEALDRLDPPRLALRPLSLGPHDRFELGIEDEVAAGGDLDAVAAGLQAVEEEALGDRVLG